MKVWKKRLVVELRSKTETTRRRATARAVVYETPAMFRTAKSTLDRTSARVGFPRALTFVGDGTMERDRSLIANSVFHRSPWRPIDEGFQFPSEPLAFLDVKLPSGNNHPYAGFFCNPYEFSKAEYEVPLSEEELIERSFSGFSSGEDTITGDPFLRPRFEMVDIPRTGDWKRQLFEASRRKNPDTRYYEECWPDGQVVQAWIETNVSGMACRVANLPTMEIAEVLYYDPS